MYFNKYFPTLQQSLKILNFSIPSKEKKPQTFRSEAILFLLLICCERNAGWILSDI